MNTETTTEATTEATTQTAAGTTSLVEAVDVTKSYRAGSRDVEILHGLSMEVRAGEMCAVMGPSGSGKSTLLYTLAGLEEPTTGAVSLLGRRTADLSRSQLAKLRRTDVGFLFQNYTPVPTLSAYENVALPFRLRGDRPPVDQIMASLETVGLTALAGSRPVVMSGGEQQRVALARVIAQRPRIVFADEPTGALDTHSGSGVLDELRSIGHQGDQCVLTITHDPFVAAECDRVLFLRDGYLVHELIQPEVSEIAALLTDLGSSTNGAAA